MTTFVHVDGEIVPSEEATVSVRDRGFRYGDAVFETIRVYGGTPFAWDRHMDRLEGSADTISLEHNLAPTDLHDRVESTLAANELTDAYVRLSITRGEQPGRLTPAAAVDPTVVILVEPLPRGGRGSEPVWDGPAACTIASTRRIPNEAIPATAKTHNFLNGILARLSARETGADEALLCDVNGTLTEGATTNLFFVSDGRLHTPAVAGQPVLPGITRAHVIELARELGITIAEDAWAVEDLLAAEEVFLTNTTWEVRPVDRIDGEPFDVGPVSERLRHAFDRLVEATCYDRTGGDRS